MAEHSRREKYRWLCGRMVAAGASRLRRTLIRLSREGPRPGGGGRGRPNRREAARLFDRDEHRMRALIQGVSGAGEGRECQLRCRGRPDGQPLAVRRGERTIAWNGRAPGRFEWANRLKVLIPTYVGQQAHA